nr:DegT/DnrJ/EryC1/StrS family aminotransferase [Candidatus Sigynarchaeota archaeon]
MDKKKLAINGGPKAITIDPRKAADLLRWPRYEPAVIDRCADLIRKGDITYNQDLVFQLGDGFAKYLGAEYCLPVSRGTDALFIAYNILGVGPGTEVICPTYTFWATAMPAANLGAKIVFAEADPKTFNMDPADVCKKITPKTKLIIPMHSWGIPCEMDEINEIARERGIKVVEDASHAHGSTYKGKKIGTLSDIAAFSIQNSKLLPAGEGGLFVTNTLEYFEDACAWTDYFLIQRGFAGERWRKYERTGLGWNLRISALNAAIGIEMLKVLDRNNAIINRNCVRFNAALEKTGYFRVPHPAPGVTRVYYENIVYYDFKATGVPPVKLMEALRAEGCDVNATRYPLLHQQPYFVERGSDPNGLPVTDELLNHLMQVPKFPAENDDIIDQYIAAFNKVLGVLVK